MTVDAKELADRIDGSQFSVGCNSEELAYIAKALRDSVRPEVEAIKEALGVIFHNVDTNGDPVGAQPKGPWETGYCAGIRFAYRTLKARGVVIQSPPQSRSE